MKAFFVFPLFLVAGLVYAAQPDLCVVLVDSLRADHLGCYGYERDMSPTVDVFAVRHAAATVAGR